MTLNTFRSPTTLTHIHTFLLSWAASSFFWISASDGFWRGGVVALSSGAPSKVGGFRMTSKAWPLARLLSSITSMSRMLQRFKSTTPAVAERGWGGEMKRSRGYYGFIWLTSLLGLTLNYCFVHLPRTWTNWALQLLKHWFSQVLWPELPVHEIQIFITHYWAGW